MTASPLQIFKHMNYTEKKSKISVQCEICGVTKPSHNYMKVHMANAHNIGGKGRKSYPSCMKVQCELCGVSKWPASLRAHMLKVHGAEMKIKEGKEAGALKCDAEGCTFETFYPGAFKGHQKRHRIPLEE